MAGDGEIGRSIDAGGVMTNCLDSGSGDAVLFLHGSGPGVTAWANWRLTIPEISRAFRVIAPDQVGFGYTRRPEGFRYEKDAWVGHVVDLLDALELPAVHVVGNSFGGAIALALGAKHPERVRRLVLMGSVGVTFPLTDALDAAWGYTPSIENMRRLLDVFAYDRSLVTDDLAKLRYEASIRPGFQDSFAAMFPAPRQRWIDALATPEADIRALKHETLIIHGRDDKVIPLSTSLDLLRLIPRSQLHVFGRCGHWTQIEHAARFTALVQGFLGEERPA